MQKIVITCPKCKHKMKISNKRAKYRCPHCKEIYKFSFLKQLYTNIKLFILGFFETLLDIKNNIIKKYRDTKATYKYMKQVRNNLKRDPNWSQYRNEQREQKEVNSKFKFKNFLNKFSKR